MTILILGDDTDEHARHVYDRLVERDADVVWFDPTTFPASMRITFDPIGGEGHFVLTGNGRERVVPFAEIRSVYWRTYGGVGSVDLPDAEQSYIAENDARSLVESLFRVLRCRWVNGWDAYQLHQVKPAALARVAALGVDCPATLLSNDPDEVVAFVAERGECIFKPVQGGAHTRPVTAAHLTPEHLEHLRLAPVTIQEQVPGSDVRVFVAADRVLACELRTDSLDFRDDPDPPIVAIDLPTEIVEQSLGIARALHLEWTGMDYRRTPEGRYLFFEANPSPMFIGFESRSGLPLTQALLDLLAVQG